MLKAQQATHDAIATNTVPNHPITSGVITGNDKDRVPSYLPSCPGLRHAANSRPAGRSVQSICSAWGRRPLWGQAALEWDAILLGTESLSLPTSFEVLKELSSSDQGIEFLPSPPDCNPPGISVGLSSKESSEFGKFTVELMDGQVVDAS